jgi:hypothetical protein
MMGALWEMGGREGGISQDSTHLDQGDTPLCDEGCREIADVEKSPIMRACSEDAMNHLVWLHEIQAPLDIPRSLVLGCTSVSSGRRSVAQMTEHEDITEHHVPVNQTLFTRGTLSSRTASPHLPHISLFNGILSLPTRARNHKDLFPPSPSATSIPLASRFGNPYISSHRHPR